MRQPERLSRPYRSTFTGARCRCLATRKSSNRKTGPMVQLWFLRSDREPHRAAADGSDQAICGNCPQRHSVGGHCYVVTCEGPLAIHRAQEKSRRRATPFWRHQAVRIGAYGDPASMPRARFEALWTELEPRRWTGYTHAWRRQSAQWLQAYCMASVDNVEEQREAVAKGWRTFRCRQEGETLLEGEIQCPAEARGVKCINCCLCHGGARGPNVAIFAHGSFLRKRS